MQISPLITIVIPTYNSEKCIEACINSVVSQTYNNIELLIVDGLSTDDTINVVNSYMAKYHYIRVISERDKGIYDAMNKGVELARGEWIYFLGSDDSFFDNKVLEDVAIRLINSDIDVLYGDVFVTDWNKTYDGEFTFHKIQSLNICHQSIFCRKNVIESFGFFNLKYKSLADYDFNLKWFFSSKIKNMYFDRIITRYSMGGFSEAFYDEAFYRDKEIKLFKVGFTKLSAFDLKELSFLIAGKKRDNHNYFQFIYFQFIYYFFRVIDLMQRKLYN
jgi:glycosyltransferase involved in cell wall biosynthesis